MEPDLRDLLSSWLGGELEAARCDELLARLRRDEAFRLAFVDEIRMLGMLKAVQSAQPPWLRLEDQLGWSAPQPGAAEMAAQGDARRPRHLPRRRRPRAGRGRGAAAAP